VTRYNLPPADDPASIESFLRLRRSQLPGGRPPVRGTREEAERQSAEQDAERIVDLLRRMPVEEYVPAAEAGPEALEAAQYDWLRRHGLERGRVDAALGALRRSLTQQVHRDRVTSSTASVTAAGGTGHGSGTAARPPVTARDRERIMLLVGHARSIGVDPDRKWPNWRELVVGAEPASLTAAGSGMTTAEYNRWERDATARRDLARRWRVLNERLFGGALPVPDFKVVRTNDLLAARETKLLDLAAWHAVGHRAGRGTITVRTNEVADNGVLVHEMVHQWQDHRGLPIDHGDEFIRRANYIAEAGRLPFVHDPTRWPHDQALAASGAAPGRCGVVDLDSGKYGRPTGGANSFNTVSGPRVAARPGRISTGGRAQPVVPATSADRPVSRATGRRPSWVAPTT
jgi:hypothetical protein